MEFQCFTSMSCVFDTSKSWTVSASYSHYASSSGLLISHTIWRHASFIETIHPPSTPCFNTHINFAIKTNWSRLCLDFKRVNGLCYNKLFFFCAPAFCFHFRNSRFPTNRHGCYSKDVWCPSSCLLIADYGSIAVIISEHLYGRFYFRKDKFKYLPLRGVLLVPGYTSWKLPSYLGIFINTCSSLGHHRR